MTKRKGIPWGPSNPLWKWQHRKANKPSKRKVSTIDMPKKRSHRGKARRWFHRRDKRIPIVPVIALASTVITPCPSGRSLVQDAMHGDFESLIYDAREKFAGIDNGGHINTTWLLETWGPVIIGALISKFAGKLVNPSLSKIPFVGKYVRL